MPTCCVEAPSETKLFPYQREAVTKLLKLGGSGGIFMEMGTGKTRVALEVASQLGCKRILVVTPLSVVSVWKREVASYWSDRPNLVLDCTAGSIPVRSALLRKNGQNLVVGESEGSCVAIVGYESYWREPLRSAILSYAPDVVIFDEAHRLKSGRTRQSRFAHFLSTRVPFRLALTGTPMPNGPEDLFSLYKAIRPEVFGTRWQDFEWRYINRGGYLGYQIVGYRNMEELEAKVAATSFRVTKAEALDLPEQVDVVVPVQLSDRRVYEALRRQAIAEVEGVLASGKPASGVALAQTALVNILRLQQVTSGFVRTTDGELVSVGTEKYETLKDLLEDMLPQGRVVVFCRFTYDVDQAVKAAGADALVLDGRVPPAEREKAIAKFMETPHSVLVAQVAVGSLGIDLSCAHNAVFFSLDYSYANYVQSRDRLHRLGQGSKVTYYHLVADHTIDEKVLRILQRKQDISKQVLDAARVRELFS